MASRRDVVIYGQPISPGERRTIELPIPKLYTDATLAMPVHVLHGKRAGPRLFITAALHGDEINGVEIIRRLLATPSLKKMRGTLLAVPIVNVHGFINHTRYLPDRRDLNRSFPGTEKGSLASRVASLLMREIIEESTHGIDLHTGAVHRSNLPQIRADLDSSDTLPLARAFGAPVVLNANLRDGSLRQAARERDIPMLLYETGEALRFDEVGIRAGVKGIINVMRALEMLPASRRKKSPPEPVIARTSTWVRAPESGILHARLPLGTRVDKGDVLGTISDPFGQREQPVKSVTDGIVIGRTNIPLVNEGDALFHIACFHELEQAEQNVEAFKEAHLEQAPGDDSDIYWI